MMDSHTMNRQYNHNNADADDSPNRNHLPPAAQLSSESLKARLFLAVAFLWPLMLLALFASSAPRHYGASHYNNNNNNNNNNISSLAANNNNLPGGNLRLSLRNALDRVDIMGYGPTHPRVAFCVVAAADQTEAIISTVKSIISHTDLSRIFVIAVVVDGKESDPDLVQQLRSMEAGSVPHWHGQHVDVHQSSQGGDEQNSNHEEEEHGRKVHVIFNKEKFGLAASREDAVDFVHLLATYHEEAGLKSHAEDLLLMLMEPGSQVLSHKWLSPVTRALIVPPPLLPHSLEEVAGEPVVDPSNMVSLKLANAVVFPVKGMEQGQRVSLDINLAPIDSTASVEELNGSSGDSYMSPVWDGVGICMRLETYRNLPLPQAVPSFSDDDWSSNLDISMALWLCADGMDILSELEIQRSPQIQTPAGLSPAAASRFAAAWMDDVASNKFFEAYHKIHGEITALDWNLWHAHSDAVWRNSRPHCRSFEWYIKEINPELGAAMRESLIEDAYSNGFNEDLHQEAMEEEQSEQVDLDELPVVVEKKAEQPPAKKQEDPGADSVTIPERREPKKPSKPLCDECLKIVEQAKPIDLIFVDVSNGHHDHPHMGAKDVDGNFGYVHDETHLRKNPPPFGMAKENLAKACSQRDNNYRMLTEKVYVDIAGHEAADKSGKPRDKIFCLVYTTEKQHNRIPRIRETWGQKCDGFMVGSTKTDPSIDTVEIPHEGEEEYNNIWQKVRSMWAYIYDNYYEKYDWFHIGGDDLYLLVENLRLYLESEEIKTAANGGIYLPDGSETSQTPLFLGRRFAYQGDMNDIFISGGSGYTMNKAALKALVVDGLPNIFPHAHTFSEDTMIARLFRKKFGVVPYETKDEAGGERYMPFMPGHHWGYRLPENPASDWYAKYSINIKEGPDHCAAKSVAFHYVKDEAMYRLHALLYHLCPTGKV